jgi:hypothetical protein
MPRLAKRRQEENGGWVTLAWDTDDECDDSQSYKVNKHMSEKELEMRERAKLNMINRVSAAEARTDYVPPHLMFENELIRLHALRLPERRKREDELYASSWYTQSRKREALWNRPSRNRKQLTTSCPTTTTTARTTDQSTSGDNPSTSQMNHRSANMEHAAHDRGKSATS